VKPEQARQLHAAEGVTGVVAKLTASYLSGACGSGEEGGGGVPSKDEVRSRWLATRQSWDEIGAGDVVDYDGPVQLSYACGTTPLHAIALHELIGVEPVLREAVAKAKQEGRALKVVALCGGSGAELMAWSLHCAAEGVALHVTVIDWMESWRPALEAYLQALKASSSSEVEMCFERLNLLEESGIRRACEVVAGAEVVSLIYGFTELVRHHTAKAREALKALFHAVPEKATLLIADPRRSHRDCDQSHLAEEAAVEANLCGLEGYDIKVSVTRQHFEASELHPWIERLGLRFGEDIKLSAHNWVRLYRGGPAVERGAAAAEGEKLPPLLEAPPPKGPHVAEGVLMLLVPDAGLDSWLELVSDSDPLPGLVTVSVEGSHWGRTAHALGAAVEANGVMLIGFSQLTRIAQGPKDELHQRHHAGCLAALRRARTVVLDEAHRCLERLPRSKASVLSSLEPLVPSHRIVLSPQELEERPEVDTALVAFAGKLGEVQRHQRGGAELSAALEARGIERIDVSLPLPPLSAAIRDLPPGDSLLAQIHPACLEAKRHRAVAKAEAKPKRKKQGDEVGPVPGLDWAPARSGRMDGLLQLLRGASSQGEKVVVYCRLIASMDAIEECIAVENLGRSSRREASLEWIRVEEFKRQQAKRRKKLEPVKRGGGWSLCLHAVKAVDDFVSLPSDIAHVVLFDSDEALAVEAGRFSEAHIVSGAVGVWRGPGPVRVYRYGPA